MKKRNSKRKPKQIFTLDPSIKDKNGRKPYVINKGQYLVWKFCKFPESVNWPYEIAVSNKLLALHPIDFWKMASLSFKVPSLAWFLTSDGKNFMTLTLAKKDLDFSPKKSYHLEHEKIGEDTVVVRKPTTVFEFLNHKHDKEK